QQPGSPLGPGSPQGSSSPQQPGSPLGPGSPQGSSSPQLPGLPQEPSSPQIHPTRARPQRPACPQRPGALLGPGSPQGPPSPQQPSSPQGPQLPTLPTTHGCGIPTGEQVTCGQSGISSSDCEMMGCCVDSSTSTCYYPMDECTVDQHFVFAIRANSASIPVDPTKLVVSGSTNCKPVIVNDKVAIFKFKNSECGVHAYEVGETMIYLAEVQTVVQSLTLQYGVIATRDPLRFMVECRYSKAGVAPQSLTSIGYMVKTPSSTLPSAVLSNGLYAVDLRIAKDQTYSSYLPTNNQPLRLLLGSPVYLELRLISPKPDAVILVNYCVAYPRSARNALVLIYEGCPNLYAPNVSLLKIIDCKNRHQRRFVVEAFQFMVQKTNKYLDEEIYFMCSTEVCLPADRPCEQRCFDGKAP
ncbi:zona pellucida sperm-binding protein 4-like, partial [Micropterus salmoides]|uniref:zona pellucida sperm-binding protein 4-like n=1 Tax=Micropterus salmoides TaxID=27706 RepID=UPI0018ED666A